MNKEAVKQFLIEKKGYLKKSALEVAKVLWKNSNKYTLSKHTEQLKKDIKEISLIQAALRKAQEYEVNIHDNILLDAYNQIIEEKNRPKRILFFDIETSPNIGFFWKSGYKLNIPFENIIQERAIICVCAKWNNDEEVKSFKWNRGDDKTLLKEFSKLINSADIVVSHNGDKFDIRWLRTRCLLYGIELKTKFNSIDTLKLARNNFNFNSNKLDYIAKLLLGEGKSETTYSLWKDIVLKNDKKSMEIMVNYCKKDVLLLEEIYNKLYPYTTPKKFKYIL